jgi:hypothetical protein
MRIFGFNITRRMSAEQRIQFAILRMNVELAALEEEIGRLNALLVQDLRDGRRSPYGERALQVKAKADGIRKAMDTLSEFFRD